ncbi:MAG: ImmA/IrrE family metallo-endopeptidase [Sphaerochaetaceae bacterium]|nr:ImmA/IrrE family metallo-endopeptidase [Sphaerochaetaceae bacterium]
MEYNWPGYKVLPLSRKDIEVQLHMYLSENYYSCFKKEKKINFENLIDQIFLTLGYTLVIDNENKYLQENEAAKTDFLRKEIIIPVNCYNTLTNNGRSRFTLAHEIGHVILHSEQLSKQIQTAARTNNVMKLKAFESSEWQANYFAAALLMNKEDFTAEFYRLKNEESINIIVELSKIFCTSLESTKRRIKGLQLT